MPDSPVSEIRLPELHLPEIKRDDIVRSLSAIRMPDIDMPKVSRPKVDLPSMPSIPNVDFSKIDIGKAVAGAAAAVHIGRGARRPRWPFAIGTLVVVGLATWAIMSNQALRARLISAAAAVRERIATMTAGYDDRLDVDMDDPIAFDAANTAPIDPGPYSDASLTSAEPTPYPEGLGNGRNNDEIASEESGLPKIPAK